jgi:hypothetical protein
MNNLLREYIRQSLFVQQLNEARVNLNEVKSPDLKSGTMLGYAGEQAVYAAMGTPPLTFEELEKNLIGDVRIIKNYNSSNQQQWDTFVNIADVMKENIANKFEEMGLEFTRPPSAPGGGSDEYDLVAKAGERSFNIHVKYKSNRLVGIPQPKLAKIKDPETGKIDKEATEAAAEAAAAGNPSVIYKNVRDSLLFKDGVQGGTGSLTLGKKGGPLKATGLTDYGISVKEAQGKGAAAPSEIAIMITNEEFRTKLFDALKAANFGGVISSSIKQQLGLEKKGDETRTSMFINFTENDVHVQRFAPEQGAKVKFILVPGTTTSSAYTVMAVFTDKAVKVKVPAAFNVELGSIVRAKYVQIHKGTGFDQFVSELENKKT